MNRLRKSVAALLLAGGAVGAYFGGSAIMRNAAFADQQREVKAATAQLAATTDLSAKFRLIGTMLEPSVVNISVHKTAKGPDGVPFDDGFKPFFKENPRNPKNPDKEDDNGDQNEGGSQDQVGTGSGVIMEVDGNTGYILTNNHVAGDATQILVTLADGRQVDGKLVGHDPKSDLAVVKITEDNLIAAKWGNSADLRKGDWILAFGSPFGYVGSMTHGIVSALDRSNVGILGNNGYEDFIQVDAPINPGNSGGPLVNLNGEVVGINTAIASRTGAFSGIGFAIPSKEAEFVFNQLRSSGKVTRGWLGVSISDVSHNLDLAKSFGYMGRTGVLVQSALPNTPAAGILQGGDIITSIITSVDNTPVHNVVSLRNAIASIAPNTTVKMTVFRDKKEQVVELKLGEQPEDMNIKVSDPRLPAPSKRHEIAKTDVMGLTLSDLPDENAEGAVVTRVKSKSPAFIAGVRAGDVILKVGETPVKNAAEATALLKKCDPSVGVRLYISTGETRDFVFVKPE